MTAERTRVRFHRILRLAEKLRGEKYRHSYVGAHIRQFLARQMREMRADTSQAEFGAKIGKLQNVVSRYEDPAYGKWTLSSLLEIAEKLDRALIVRFVDFPTFLKLTDDQSAFAASPPPYHQPTVDGFAWAIAQQQTAFGHRGIYEPLPSSSFTVMDAPTTSPIDILVKVPEHGTVVTSKELH